MSANTDTLQLRSTADHRGVLTFVEGERDIPFAIRRIYWLDNLSSKHPRGFHAHRKLQQAVFCLRGSCDIVIDNGNSRQTTKLDNPSYGLLIGNMVWREMCFSGDGLLLVLANEYYDKDDYIRDYSLFLQGIKNVS